MGCRRAKQEEESEKDGEMRLFLKKLKSPISTSNGQNTSWSVFKTLNKGLEGFRDESKAWKIPIMNHYCGS